ncbi:MAG: M28 family peptidase [Bacteroidota bacterium]
MIKLPVFSLAIFLLGCSSSKKANLAINETDVTRIETVLSHDSMEGRKTFTRGIDKAAAFIASEMKLSGLKVYGNAAGYLQSFEMINGTVATTDVSINGTAIPASNVICVSSNENITFSEADKYTIVTINKADTFRNKIRTILNKKQNTLVLIDTSFSRNFKSLNQIKGPAFESDINQVFVLTGNMDVTNYSVKITQKANKLKLSNVVGLLPGKTRTNEYVIFAGHYDHLGFSRPDSTGDSLYNGANDDASGITAMLMLAKYYKALNNNERSILFVAFTAEEMGGFGSRYFSDNLNAGSVVAMFNIEMIGTDSKWGLNSAYITGYEKTDMGKILEKNLAGSKFKFYPDPYPTQNLFYRSDNATLARKGVPAHTISTSKMDNEPHYHKASDEIKTLDMRNMTEVIKSIAISAKTIVNGKDTPTRVDTTGLR